MIVTRLVLASAAAALIFASCGGDGSGGGLFGSSGATGTGPGAGGSDAAGMGGSGSTTSNTSGSAGSAAGGSAGTAGASSTGGTAGSGTSGAAGSTAAGSGGSGGSAGATGGQSGANTGAGGSGGARDAGADGACISAEGGPCGGFIVNPCGCAAGLVCRTNINPDVGGVCVKADAGAQDAGLRACLAACDRCTRGVCCGASACCGPGEWCDESSGLPTCKCGGQLACVLPNTCHPLGPSQPNGCGAVCCFNICPQ
jgi:hypothetical protein